MSDYEDTFAALTLGPWERLVAERDALRAALDEAVELLTEMLDDELPHLYWDDRVRAVLARLGRDQ